MAAHARTELIRCIHPLAIVQHELAEGGTTINVFGGPVLNPYGNTMHVGGSSGGTTAAVAMRLAPAGFCSDTGQEELQTMHKCTAISSCVRNP